MDSNLTMSFPGSGANSPALGSSGHPHLQPSSNVHTQSMTAPASPSGAYTASALAYANAQLSHFAASGGAPAIPAHLNPHALNSALSDYSMSMPTSAASSPGATPRRLPGTGTSTPGGNSRVAASAITGKRLNWSEMICQTIAESESGRLVIQDLFEGMCAKFPEIREWAFGKDWEARVKNRIKSTLSIKGNLFIKVPRPSSAAGKGSWWTLSAEAQEAWKTGRVANVVKNNGHSRAASAGPSSIHGSPVRTVSSKFGGPSTGHTPNPPYMIQGSHAHHTPSHRTSPLGLGLNSTPSGHLANLDTFNFGGGDGLSYGTGAPGQDQNGKHDPNAASSQLQNAMANNQMQSSQGPGQQQGMVSPPQSSAPGPDYSNLGFLKGNNNQGLGAAQSMAHLGGPQSMPFPASSQNSTASSLDNFGPLDSSDYSALFEGLAGFSSGNGDDLGANNNSQLGMGGMPFNFEDSAHHPFGGSIPGAYTLLQNQQGNGAGSNQFNNFAGQAPYGMNPNQGQPPSQGLHQQNSGGSNDFASSASPFPGSSGLEGPSPADSTWFSYTPLVQPSNDASQNTSAPGQLGGEGSKKRRASEGLKDISEFQLPPAEAGS